MARGKVHNINVARGYGFIRPDQSGIGDCFFHSSNAPSWENIATGDEVEFQVRTSKRSGKLEAFEVRLAA